MRFTVVALIALCLVSLVIASPAKNSKQAASACSTDCGQTYEPVCGKAKSGNSSKERLLTFGNECVMEKFNCEHKDDQYEVKEKKECGGNVSVRLS